MKHEFICSQCNEHKTHKSDMTTGYGTNKEGGKICFSCCGKNDILELINLQNKQKVWQYFDGKNIVNWPSTMKIKPNFTKKGRHNIAGSREDVWFTIGIGYVNNNELPIINGNAIVDGKEIKLNKRDNGYFIEDQEKCILIDGITWLKFHGIQYGNNSQILHIKKVA